MSKNLLKFQIKKKELKKSPAALIHEGEGDFNKPNLKISKTTLNQGGSLQGEEAVYLDRHGTLFLLYK